MSFKNIQIALDTALKLVPSVPTIAWPNTLFTPTIGTPFVVPNLLPAANTVSTSVETYKGIYQIDINVPINKGTSQIYAIADAIKTYFQAKSLVANGQTTLIQAVSLGLVQRDNAWYSTNVDINYSSFV